MKLRRFLIPSLAAAGLLPQHSLAIPPDQTSVDQNDGPSLFQLFTLQHMYDLAAHRSHSSHASHSSHRSSSTPTYRAPMKSFPSTPAPLYTPPATTFPAQPGSDSTSPNTILPSSPDAALKTLPGNSNKFIEIAKQVQLALYSWGYYTGTIDGIVGPETKVAISTLQADWNLKVTGTITPEVLDALKIVAE